MSSRYLKKVLLCVLLLSPGLAARTEKGTSFLEWRVLSQLPQGAGKRGIYAGISNDRLLVAGGLSEIVSGSDTTEVWHDGIWVLDLTSDGSQWRQAGRLDKPLAYGACVTIPDGIVCMGGTTDGLYSGDVILLHWQPESETVTQEILPALPAACAFSSATAFGSTIYLSGGRGEPDSSSILHNFWKLDIAGGSGWQQLPVWPGAARFDHMTVAQHDGNNDVVYLFGGRTFLSNKPVFLNDVYAFTPDKSSWQRVSDLPVNRISGTAVAVGQSHIFIVSGEDGPGSNSDSGTVAPAGNRAWIYHTITDSWIAGEQLPANLVSAVAVRRNNQFLLTGAETAKAGSPGAVWQIQARSTTPSFGFVNFVTLIVYMLLMAGVGAYFYRRNKDTEDYFRGGRKIPWLASGLSIFATVLSSITFLSIPAKAYASNWVLILINMTVIAVIPLTLYLVVPYFQKLDVTSAYEYLEQRFNLAVRLFGSASFILFQIGRMAMVLFLPALALATITGIDIRYCIFLMGIVSVFYCTTGGIKAVIWTDTIQSFVLLGGALFTIIVILLQVEGGMSGLWHAALADDKLRLANLDWSSTSYTTAALWVVIVGGIGQSLIPYTSDQSVVQRYMSVPGWSEAAKAGWTNMFVTVFASLLFFGVGTALYVYYQNFPERLDPTYQTDAIFALFIARELPVGISGFVVAGVFAAAQSTISTSMNSTATAIVTDFIRRFGLIREEAKLLRVSQLLTFVLGCLGTGIALILASADIKSMWDAFMSILGLFGGTLCGLFLLGVLTRTANGPGALIGAVAGVVTLIVVQMYSRISFLLYGAIGISACFISGYVASFFFSKAKLSNLKQNQNRVR